MRFKDVLAKTIRVLSVPPVMVTSLILILAFNKDGIFRSTSEVAISILLLGFVPVLAYGLQKILPGYKGQGRKGQRKLAFITSIIGYTCALIWAFAAGVNISLLFICATYFFSVVLLTVCNKGFHYRASGHACSFTGPLVLLVYFFGLKVLVPCLVIAGLIVWSSIYLKRHTLKELVGGMVSCLLAFGLSMILTSFL